MAVTVATENLRDQVLATMCKHWQKPRRADLAAPVPAAEVDKVARATLDTMLTPVKLRTIAAINATRLMLNLWFGSGSGDRYCLF